MIEDEIIGIEKLENDLTIDIEVSGNHLFYANDILTHNSNSDVGLENTSESFGLPATADFMFAIMSNEGLDKNGHILVKQLKNRYNDVATKRKFVVGVNRAKMKLYDAEDSAQDGLVGTGEEDDIGTEGFKNKFGKNSEKYQDKIKSWNMSNE
jgi:hypothetical protein